MKPEEHEVLIIGGGVIGLSIGYYLTREGYPVTIVDRDPELLSSCSDKNAGMVVPSHFLPLPAPGVIQQGIKWMMQAKSPFALRPSLDLSLAEWVYRFTRHSTEKHAKRSQHLLRDLNLESRRLHSELAAEHDYPLVERGLLMLSLSKRRGARGRSQNGRESKIPRFARRGL